MKSPIHHLYVLLFAALLGAHSGAGVAAATDQAPAPPQEGPVLLRGGDLYTISGGVLEATDLLFENGKITALGKDLDAPPSAEVVDVSGSRVYPGLIAPQTTLGLTEIDAVRATKDADEVGDINPEVRAHVAYNPDTEHIPTVRSNGITTVQVAPLGSLVRGQSFIVHLDGWTKEDAAVRLDDGIFLSWPRTRVLDFFFMPPVDIQRRRMREERDALRAAFDAARAYDAARRAGVEVETDIRWEAMRPLFAGEKPLYVKADDYRQINQAIAFAEDYGIRLVLVGAMDSHLVADLLAEKKIPVMLGSTQSLPMREDDPYDMPFRVASLLHEAGVEFCFAHNDSGGSWTTRNLAMQAAQAVAFGLPEDVALASLTLTTAKILGIDDRQGSLEVGKDATLIVSTGDVMDTLGLDVTRMWIGGRAVDLDDRHKRLYRKYDQKPAAASP